MGGGGAGSGEGKSWHWLKTQKQVGKGERHSPEYGGTVSRNWKAII